MFEIAALAASTVDQRVKLARFHRDLKEFPQIEIHTEHLIHGLIYSRTIRLKRGDITLGSIVMHPTTLIINGPVSITNGSKQTELDGYNVIPGAAGRQQIFVARGDVQITMIFATNAQTVEEVEDILFDDPSILMSRANENTITVTGE